jgi:hypothetical protein
MPYGASSVATFCYLKRKVSESGFRIFNSIPFSVSIASIFRWRIEKQKKASALATFSDNLAKAEVFTHFTSTI